jgi:hypothetical protein
VVAREILMVFAVEPTNLTTHQLLHEWALVFRIAPEIE